MAAPTAESVFDGPQRALGIAIEADSVDNVKDALNTGANVNAAGKHGVTPLIFAAARPGGAAVIEALLAAGADPAARDGNGHSAVTVGVLAAHPVQGKSDLTGLEAVLRGGGNPNDTFPDGDPAIAWAVGQNNPGLMKLLLQNGANADAVTRTGKPVIISAALGAYWDAVWVLVEGGADWRVVHKGASVPNISEQPGIGESAPSYADWKNLRAFLVKQGIELPALSAKGLSFRSGRLTDQGFVSNGG